MAHMQHTGHIWWGNNDGVGLSFVGLGVKHIVFHPVVIPLLFDLLWCVFVCKFHKKIFGFRSQILHIVAANVIPTNPGQNNGPFVMAHLTSKDTEKS
jgi:hypothetical protein